MFLGNKWGFSKQTHVLLLSMCHYHLAALFIDKRLTFTSFNLQSHKGKESANGAETIGMEKYKYNNNNNNK